MRFEAALKTTGYYPSPHEADCMYSGWLLHELQARARVGKVDDMYTNSPVSIPIAETCIQSEQAKPIEVGELFDVMNKVIYNLREGECWRKECAQAILARYNVSEKGE